MFYDIINPSDTVTLEADDVTVAQAACLLLGEGRYGLTNAEGEEVLPLCLFEGQFEEWSKGQNFDLENILKNRREEVAVCLRSAMCCSMNDRIAIVAAVGDDPEALARYNDAKRSSLNDICELAVSLASHGLEVVS